MKRRYLYLLSLLMLLAIVPLGPAAASFVSAPSTINPYPQIDPKPAAIPIPVGGNDAAVEWLSSIGGTPSTIGTDGTIAYIGGSTGLTLLDVRDPTKPVRLASLSTPGSLAFSRDIFRVGRTLYIATVSDLQIIDISNPSHPQWMATYTTVPSVINTVWVVGIRAYVAGSSALEILDISDPTHPILLGSYAENYLNALDIQVIGDLAYAMTPSGVIIVDVHDPAHPGKKTSFGVGGVFGIYARTFQIVGNLVYSIATSEPTSTSCGRVWFSVTDIGDPAAPAARGALELPTGTCQPALRVVDKHAYVVGIGSGLQVIDVGNPDRPIRQSSHGSFVGKDLRVVSNRAFVAGSAGVQIIDVSNPSRLTLKGTYQPIQDAKDIQVVGNLAYVAAGVEGLRIFDVADPTHPFLRSSVDTPGDAHSLQMVGQLAFIADGDTGLRIFDVADPTHPFLRSSVDTPGSAHDVQVVDSLAYIADGANGLQVVDVSNPANPELGGSAQVPNTQNHARRLQIVGRRAYIADSILGILIFELSDRVHPKLIYGGQAAHNIDLQVVGDHVYTIQCFLDPQCEPYLNRYRINDPPGLVWDRNLEEILPPQCLHLAGDRLYIFGGHINIVSAGDPTNTQVLANGYSLMLRSGDGYGYYPTEEYCGLQSVGNLIYIAYGGVAILRAHPDLFWATADITSASGSLVSYDQDLSLSFPTSSVVDTATVTYKGLFFPSQPPYAGRGALRSFTLEAREAMAAPSRRQPCPTPW